MRLFYTIKYDVLSQFRYGFYYAYIAILILYYALLSNLPTELRNDMEVLIIFSDPSAVGYFIIGGIILLEIDQNTLENLFVTPVRIYEYIFSKVISLTFLAVIITLIIVLTTWEGQLHLFTLLLGVILTSIFFTLLGLTAAVYSNSINEYLLKAPLIVSVFYLPVLEYLDIYAHPLFNLIPGKASLVLLEAGFEEINPLAMFYAIGTLSVWIVLAYLLAHRSFYRRIILRIGGR
ncbi:hypothetical protein [Gracilibacillus saliphilus]|uniref:fluoroquinolone export ABC transporter permease subunit n=1 Tax=Gracilibacillus saliphilus TaxID=543890 RepID=UPI0013D6F9BF|nr:hypothetical protein [Gracilibacillus saliphilus]